MMLNLIFVVIRKSDDVGEMRPNTGLVAQSNDLSILSGMIMIFSCCFKRLAIKGFDADEHLVTTSTTKQFHQFRVLCNLGITLTEKPQVQSLIDHCLQ